MTAIELIAAERQRQISVEGWTPAHDDEHDGEQLALAAAFYTLPMSVRNEQAWFTSPPTHWGREALAKRSIADFIWPWTHNWRKPTPEDRTRELIKAAAMLVAEIERRQREAAR